MNAQDILDTIQDVARKHLDWDGQLAAKGSLKPEMRLVEDLELDSVDMTTLAVEVEDHFDISLEAADEEQIVTVGDLVRVVGRELEGRHAESGA